MNDIKITFAPTITDYHIAVYYAAVNRYKLGFRLLVVSGLTAIACWVSAYLGLMPHVMFTAYIFLGFAVWALLICAQMERGVLKYAKQPDNILGKEMSLTFNRTTMKIDTPYNKKKDTVELNRLFCVFEISSMFLIYLDGAQSLILPHRAMTAQQRSEIRSIIADNIHDRLYTRFGYNNMLPKRSPLRR